MIGGWRGQDLALAALVNGLVFGLAIHGLGAVDLADPRAHRSHPDVATVTIPLVASPAGGAGPEALAPGVEPSAGPDSLVAPQDEEPAPAATPAGRKGNPSKRKKRAPAPAGEEVPTPEGESNDGGSPAPDEGSPTAEGDASPSTGEEAGAAEGHEGGEGAGGAGDPLAARALAYYRNRLSAWFARHFRVRGSGLSADQLAHLRARVRVEVDEERRIQAYTVIAADHEAFRKAARETMEALIGSQLPEPPPGYPGALQRQIVITFTCSETACD